MCRFVARPDLERITLPAVKARMRKARQEAALPTCVLSKISGVSEATVRRWDNPSDATQPGLLGVARICWQYGLSLDSLVFKGLFCDDTDARFDRVMQRLRVSLTPAQKDAAVMFLLAFLERPTQ